MPNINRRVLPGFSLTLGLLGLLPERAGADSRRGLLSEGVVADVDILGAVWTDRARAAYRLTFGTSSWRRSINVFLGLLVAWMLVRYEFPCKRLVDALVDLPFALPTAVAGLVYATLVRGERLARAVPGAARDQGGVYAARHRARADVHRACRSSCERCSRCWKTSTPETEEAAGSPRRDPLADVPRVILPTLLAGARDGLRAGVRARGRRVRSVVFVSGNMPFETEIAPVLIVARLEEFAYSRGDGDRGRAARRVVRAAGADQPARTLEQARMALSPGAATQRHGRRVRRRSAGSAAGPRRADAAALLIVGVLDRRADRQRVRRRPCRHWRRRLLAAT